MSACGISTVGGAPAAGGGSTPPPLQGAIFQGVDVAGVTGSVDDTVVRFNGATTQIGSIAVATWVTRTDSLTLGSTFDFLESGLYSVLFYVPMAGGQTAQLAITYNATALQRQSNVEPFEVEVYSSGFVFGSLLSGLFPPLATVPVRPADVLAGTATLRAQASDVANGPPAGAAFIDPANVALRVLRLGDQGD